MSQKDTRELLKILLDVVGEWQAPLLAFAAGAPLKEYKDKETINRVLTEIYNDKDNNIWKKKYPILDEYLNSSDAKKLWNLYAVDYVKIADIWLQTDNNGSNKLMIHDNESRTPEEWSLSEEEFDEILSLTDDGSLKNIFASIPFDEVLFNEMIGIVEDDVRVLSFHGSKYVIDGYYPHSVEDSKDYSDDWWAVNYLEKYDAMEWYNNIRVGIEVIEELEINEPKLQSKPKELGGM